MLVYKNESLVPIGYTDLDFQSDLESRKSTLGYVFTLEGGAISWRSVKQSSIVDSTMEVEYMAASEAAKALWIWEWCLLCSQLLHFTMIIVERLPIRRNLEAIREKNT